MRDARPRRERIVAALDYIAREKREKAEPAIVIRRLVEEHGGRFTKLPTGNSLFVAATRATCTWSEGEGLLEAWTRNATLALIKLDGRSA